MGGGAQPKQLVQDFLQAQGKSFAAAGSNQNTVGLEYCQWSSFSQFSVTSLTLLFLQGGVSSLQAQSALPSKHNAEVHGPHAKKVTYAVLQRLTVLCQEHYSMSNV